MNRGVLTPIFNLELELFFNNLAFKNVKMKL